MHVGRHIKLPSVFPPASFGFAAIQQTAGNLAIQRLFDSDLPEARFTTSQSEVVRGEGTAFTGENITTAAMPSNQSSVVSKQVAAPQAKKGNEFLPALDETGLKKSVADEAPVGREISGETTTPEEAPATPEEDPQYQVVVEAMAIKAKHQKTPSKTPEQKQGETVLAAKAATKELTNTRYAKENHLNKIGASAT